MLKDIKKNIVFILLCFLILILLTVFLYRYKNILEGLTGGNDLKYVKYTPVTCSSNIANCPTVEKGFSFNLNTSPTGSNTSFYLLPSQFNPLITAKLLDTSYKFNSDSNGNLYKIDDSVQVFDENNNPITFTKIKTGSFLNCLLPFSKESLGNYSGVNSVVFKKFTYDSNNSKQPLTFTINNGAKDLLFDISLNKDTIYKINSTFLDLAKKNNSKDENFYFRTFGIQYIPSTDASGIKIEMNTYNKYNILITKKDKSIDTLSNIHESQMLFFVSCILNINPISKEGDGTRELDVDKSVGNVNTNYYITLNGVPIPQTQTNYTSGLLSCNTNKYFVIVKNQ